MQTQSTVAPVDAKLLTPGTYLLVVLMGIGAVFALIRLLFGLASVTNLNQQFPWGLWIGFDVVTGVALAAGGFTTAAISYVFGRNLYDSVVRPALLTAMLGYTAVILGLILDVGRYWNIWRPFVSWNTTSVLFEVAFCVALYSVVLYLEFLPLICHRFKESVSLPGWLRMFNRFLESMLKRSEQWLERIMFLLILSGIVLSCLHQSSLGSLMLIATYKVHPLWYTPILPLLFLLSAIAVGYPMVVFESMLAARSFKREPEMNVLTPLAKLMLALIGLYLIVKLGDMIVRGTYVYLFDNTLQSNSFIVEVLAGLILPFVLLLFKQVRQSTGWLFFTSMLYIGGVVLNRMNTFLIGYIPPYMAVRYIPAIGEVAVTIGLVAAILFMYRCFVIYFPILERTHRRNIVSGLLLLCCVLLSVPSTAWCAADDGKKEKRSIPIAEDIIPTVEDAASVRLLDDPVVNQYSDLYEPVTFMHRKHAGIIQDCSICHHRSPREKDDNYGQPETMDNLIRGKKTPTKCSACHKHPWESGRMPVPGLKGAYHRQCIRCHRHVNRQPAVDPIQYRRLVSGAIDIQSPVESAPIGCNDCHTKHVPDHIDLVRLEGKIDVRTVTENCLSCHPKQGNDILATSHWRWQGFSPFTRGNENRNDLGKRFYAINNTTISLSGNWPACTSCHIGYGWKDDNFDFADSSRIDCLVCHDTTGSYVKAPFKSGLPSSSVDLLNVAQHVGKPNRQSCGNRCHFSHGIENPLHHGAMNPELLAPIREYDVHMATDGINFYCQACHKSRNHKISGRSVSVPTVEGYYTCQHCHTARPHVDNSLLNHHLNKHTDHLACQTCHIPVYSKGAKTLDYWDWSTRDNITGNDETSGTSDTLKNDYGTRTYKETVKPAYLWYNGTVQRHFVGDPINPDQVTELNKPVGNYNDASSKIYPFKSIAGRQISDRIYNILVPPKLWKGYWQHRDWDRAAKAGLALAGLPDSGTYTFVDTLTYLGLNHEVMPKAQAFACADCHTGLVKEACERCHQPRADIDFKQLATKGFGESNKSNSYASGYIDFIFLGYTGDPIEVGGRFKTLPLQKNGFK